RQRHGECRGREGDHETRDDQRLRHGVAAEVRRRAAARDDREEQEDPATEEIEGEDLAQRVRVHDEAVEAEAHGRGAADSEELRRPHRPGWRAGAPATRSPSVTAIVSVIGTSMARISGLAQRWG